MPNGQKHPFSDSQRPAQQPSAQPLRQAPPRRREVSDIIDNLHEDLIDLERSAAGYSTLVHALSTAKQTLAPGERPKGLPVFEYKASLNGKDVVNVVSDLEDIDPQYLEYVLGPMIHAHNKRMRIAVSQLVNHAKEVYDMLEAAMVQAATTEAAHEQPAPSA